MKSNTLGNIIGCIGLVLIITVVLYFAWMLHWTAAAFVTGVILLFVADVLTDKEDRDYYP